ncbi:MAG: NAD(P)H-dependent oxidoreductase subunit E [Myxococcales bacterium]|jgi:NADH-quinone oxidoreductase subunit E|nr:NAD(P)H-dependent oxidoreductase subunit E [Myxococcales bacterium]
MDLTFVDAILTKHNRDTRSLLAIMQDIQEEVRYLPKEAVQHLSKELSIPLSRIYAMATFYNSFHLEPRGKYTCTVCMGTACHVAGAPRLVEQLERDLKIDSGKTTPDLMFSIEEVNCVGACALAPLLIVNGEYNSNMTSDAVSRKIKKLKKEEGGA